jgi:hypothetical protein
VTAVPNAAYVIDYDGTFTFSVSAGTLWMTIGRFECFPSWWSWLREFSVDGSGLQRGTALHGIVAPPLPYRMRLDVVLDECVPERLLTARVRGDLEGQARLTFEGDDSETRVHAAWSIEMMQRPMRIAARIAKTVLRWGHDRIVDATVESFRRELGSKDGG